MRLLNKGDDMDIGRIAERVVQSGGRIEYDVPSIAGKGATIQWTWQIAGGMPTIPKLIAFSKIFIKKVQSDIPRIVALRPEFLVNNVVDQAESTEILIQSNGKQGLFLSTWVTIAFKPGIDGRSLDPATFWTAVRSL